MTDEARRVVLFSASVGSGHVRAAEAVEAALRAESPGAAISGENPWSPGHRVAELLALASD